MKRFLISIFILFIGLLYYATNQPVSASTYENVNVLTTATVSAQSEYNASYGADKGIDSNASTRFSSKDGNPQWYKIDFGANVTQIIGAFTMMKFSNINGSQCGDTTISGSNDDVTYTDIANVTFPNTKINGDLKTVTFTNENAYRYYKLNFTTTSGYLGDAGFYELYAYATVPASHVNLTETLTRFTSGTANGYATADSAYDIEFVDNRPWRAFDKAAAAPWRATVTAYPHWLKYLFNKAQTILGYCVTADPTPTGSPTAWTLSGSANNTDWTTLDTETGISWASSQERCFSISSPAAYLFYKINATAGGDGAGIAELKLLGVDNTSVPAFGTSTYSYDYNSITVNANVTSTGGNTITRRGVAYKAGIYGLPLVTDGEYHDDGSYTAGTFSKTATGLKRGTCYRVAPYAVTSSGTSYGATSTVCTKPRISVRFFGDSKTWPTDSWQDLMSLKTGGKSMYQVENAYWAVAGDTCAQLLTALPGMIALGAEHADATLINCGANDFAAMPDETTWKATMQGIIDTVIAADPTTTIFITKPWKQSEDALAATLATWIDDLVALNPTTCKVGDNEALWMKGSDDGATMGFLHYTTLGRIEKANQSYNVLKQNLNPQYVPWRAP